MSANFTVFSPQQSEVLKALSVYRYLTAEQMVRLGISKNIKSLRDKTLFALRHHGCIHSEKIGSFLPDVHHLTPLGGEVLMELEGDDGITAPSNKRVPFSAQLAAHRLAQVEFHIGIQRWVENRGDAELILELQDFVKTRSKNGLATEATTKLTIPSDSKAIVPDGTFAIELYTGKQAVYLVEVHRSTQTKAVTNQLIRYCEVIKSGVIAQKYGLIAHPFICSIHKEANVLKGVKARLQNDSEFEVFKHNFVFRQIDNLSTSFKEGWHFADSSVANPFPMPNPIKNAH